jgi:cardiolipin synthase
MCLLLALPVSGMILFCLWGGTHQAKNLSLRKVAPPTERESVWMESGNNVAR